MTFSTGLTPSLSTTILVAIVAAGYIAFALSSKTRRVVPKNAPYYARSEEWPVVGALGFFTERWTFIQRASRKSPTGNFLFHVGNYQIVCLRGERSRRTFFDSKQLKLTEGYAALLGGAPTAATGEPLIEHGINNKRLIALLKGPILSKGLPDLRKDVRSHLDALVAKSTHVTNPFDTIYRTVFQLTLRTVACREIAENPALGAKLLAWYEQIERLGDTALGIMYPGLWTLDKCRRMYAGIRSYLLFKGFIDDRARTGRREDDALQFLLDEGDGVEDVIGFVMSSLFAGQLNSGINAAWMIIYLSRYPDWAQQVRAEVETVAQRYCVDDALPLKDKLSQVPIEAWEAEFPITDLCLKESIRISTHGTAFRQNLSGANLPIDGTDEVIPKNAFAIMPIADTYQDEEIYPQAQEFDPSRYLPEKAQDQKQLYAYWGWGVSRHPCLGMRFAKLENNLIVALWLAYFDSEVCDEHGNSTNTLPPVDTNRHSAHKPSAKCYVKYTLRED